MATFEELAAMILTSIGEQAISVGDKEYRLRPSLLAMTRIGSPTEIVEAYVTLTGQPQPTGNTLVDEYRRKRWTKQQFLWALTVLHACCEEDITHLIGGINPRMRYQPGLLPIDAILLLAASLLRHGVVGDVSPEDAKASSTTDYSAEFKARDFAGMAMAHLGASEADAWNMTMTSFLGAMRAKFPIDQDAPKGKAAPPSAKEHQATMAWLEKVNKARRSVH